MASHGADENRRHLDRLSGHLRRADMTARPPLNVMLNRAQPASSPLSPRSHPREAGDDPADRGRPRSPQRPAAMAHSTRTQQHHNHDMNCVALPNGQRVDLGIRDRRGPLLQTHRRPRHNRKLYTERLAPPIPEAEAAPSSARLPPGRPLYTPVSETGPPSPLDLFTPPEAAWRPSSLPVLHPSRLLSKPLGRAPSPDSGVGPQRRAYLEAMDEVFVADHGWYFEDVKESFGRVYRELATAIREKFPKLKEDIETQKRNINGAIVTVKFAEALEIVRQQKAVRGRIVHADSGLGKESAGDEMDLDEATKGPHNARDTDGMQAREPSRGGPSTDGSDVDPARPLSDDEPAMLPPMSPGYHRSARTASSRPSSSFQSPRRPSASTEGPPSSEPTTPRSLLTSSPSFASFEPLASSPIRSLGRRLTSGVFTSSPVPGTPGTGGYRSAPAPSPLDRQPKGGQHGRAAVSVLSNGHRRLLFLLAYHSVRASTTAAANALLLSLATGHPRDPLPSPLPHACIFKDPYATDPHAPASYPVWRDSRTQFLDACKHELREWQLLLDAVKRAYEEARELQGQVGAWINAVGGVRSGVVGAAATEEEGEEQEDGETYDEGVAAGDADAAHGDGASAGRVRGAATRAEPDEKRLTWVYEGVSGREFLVDLGGREGRGRREKGGRRQQRRGRSRSGRSVSLRGGGGGGEENFMR